ncbi:MAG: DUF2934 domain-containing protein [Devosia sp.]
MPAKIKTEPATLVSDDAIRQRAYYLWEADGRPDGRGDHYWGIAHAEATKAFIEATSNGVAKVTKGKSANTAPAKVAATKATKAKVKEATAPKAKVKAEAKPAKKATKPRAAVPKA